MQNGKIGVTTENIFPVIKKFLYSDHEIFLRELVANATDATQKLKTLSSRGEVQGELGDLTIRIKADKSAGTLTISDAGIGMTAQEIEKYINQIAFSGAEEFLEKYKNPEGSIIGHFGLGFYSAFMVAQKVEIRTLSFQEGAQAVAWTCDGSPDYTMEHCDKTTRGTDIILTIDPDSLEFLEDSRINGLLSKYCKFLPIPIGFGKKTEWKEGKSVETDEENIINNTNPLWKRNPSDLTDEDYKAFYQELYPFSEDPLFHIHLNVDYPFNLTGVLYFPKVKSNLDLQKNKIQLYCNQVYVTDSVEGIVPDFLTLLHGVIDSPDIPLNVSRSYLQSDSNVKKIAAHISKKVADRLNDIFKTDRAQYEEKWDSLKIFLEYGLVTDEKFFEKIEKSYLLKNSESKAFTLEEYKTLTKENQTNKDNKLVWLYASDKDQQFGFIEAAQAKGYDVLLLDSPLTAHVIGFMESKLTDVQFVRVDADVPDKLIVKSDAPTHNLTEEETACLKTRFEAEQPKDEKATYTIEFAAMGALAQPVTITQSEFMRRMKEMAAVGGGGMNFYGQMPDAYTLVVNTDHALVNEVLSKAKVEDESAATLSKQLIDLALLSNGMLKGEALNAFVKRSIDLIK